MDTFGSFNRFVTTPQGASLVSILLPQSRDYVSAASFQLLLQNPRANSSLEFGFSGALNIHDLNCELYDDHVMTAFELEALDYILRIFCQGTLPSDVHSSKALPKSRASLRNDVMEGFYRTSARIYSDNKRSVSSCAPL